MTTETWSDERLGAAYGAAFDTAAPRPLLAATVSAVRSACARPRPRFIIPLGWVGAAAAVLIVAVLGAGFALRFGLYPGGGTVTDGPPGLRTFSNGEIAFDFPEGWELRDASSMFSGGSAIAVVGTLPVNAACGFGHININCYYKQRLEPGTISVVIGTSAYRGGTIFDADRATPPTVRTTIAGMPALFTDRGRVEGDYYLADLQLSWEIAYPSTPTHVYRIDVAIRDSDLEMYRRQAEALAASFRFVDPPAPLNPAAAVAVARAALDEAEFGDRTMWQLGNEEASWYACFGDEPGEEAYAEVDSTPGEHLATPLAVTCRWSIGPEGSAFWRFELETEWTLGESRGTVRETRWLSADGSVAGSTFEGDFPPASVDEPSGEERPLDTAQDDTFYFEILAHKATYAPDEPIYAAASFTFRGPSSTERVFHASSAVIFEIEEIGGSRVMGGGVDTVCESTDVRSGEPARVPFEKSGAPTDDLTAGFDRAWYEDPELTLPPGRWRIAASLWVFLGDCSGEEHRLEASIDITVREVSDGPVPSATGTLEVGIGGDLTVAIDDRSGQLIDARAVGPGDSGPGIASGRPAGGLMARNPDASPTDLVLEWLSSNCDSRYTLRIGADPRILILGHEPIETCTNLGFGPRAIVLRFRNPVPVAEVKTTVLPGTPVHVITPLPEGTVTGDEPTQPAS